MNAATTPTIVIGSEVDHAVPRGFEFAGGRCGIKQARPDLGLIRSEPAAVAAGCFTQNRMRAACVVRNAALLRGQPIAGVVVNSGNANAMTGVEGERANEAMAAAFARLLGVDAKGVLTASTGMIGNPLPTVLIEEGIDAIHGTRGLDPRPFAQAIVTTDTCTKVASTEVIIEGRAVRVVGVAKGSGMIHPNMATTLSFVCTDAKVAPGLLQDLTRGAVEDTFNMISVDGDTSTNDMVLVLANGASEATIETPEAVKTLTAALHGVLGELAKMVARDGEGATRLLEVQVTGAPTKAAARAIARTIASSNLVKCSVFAGAPEWGRVAMAIGMSAAEQGLELSPADVKISAEGVLLYDGQGPVPSVKRADMRRALRQIDVHWSVDLGSGNEQATAYGCDFSYDYVRINADESKQVEASRAGGVNRNLTLAAYSPRLKQQLLVEGLAYVRRFMGLRAMVYLQPSAGRPGDVAANLACDLELCLDAGLKPIAVVPDAESARTIEEHMAKTGHYAAAVPPDPVTISNLLDRGHLCVLVRERPAPDAIVELALKLGIQKLIALGNDQGLRDAHGYLQRLSPDTLLTGIERGRFDTTDPDLLVLARHAASRGVPALHIIDARVPHAVVGELFTDEGIGTLITRQA